MQLKSDLFKNLVFVKIGYKSNLVTSGLFLFFCALHENTHSDVK